MEERTIVQSDLPPAYPAGGDATQVMGPGMMAPSMPYGGDMTQQAITITCPVCSTPNGPGTAYCQDCGLMFGSAPAEVAPMPDSSQLARLVEPASGKDFILNTGVNSVGREGADILLPDPTVSRRHAQVTLEAGQIVVEDFGSTNGTYVAGKPVRPGERATAYSGDAVRFGNIHLTLNLPGAGARPAESGAPVAAPVPAEDRGPQVAALRLGDGTEYPLYRGVNGLGRRSTNQIVLADAFASGRHAEITIDDSGAVLTDVGSTNGTFLDGQRLAANVPTPIADGTVIRFAKTDITYSAVGAPPSGAEATLMAPADATLMSPPAEEEPAPQAAE